MESPAFFFSLFVWFLLLSVTGYSLYVGFGPPSKALRDPFEAVSYTHLTLPTIYSV